MCSCVGLLRLGLLGWWAMQDRELYQRILGLRRTKVHSECPLERLPFSAFHHWTPSTPNPYQEAEASRSPKSTSQSPLETKIIPASGLASAGRYIDFNTNTRWLQHRIPYLDADASRSPKTLAEHGLNPYTMRCQVIAETPTGQLTPGRSPGGWVLHHDSHQRS